MDDRDEPNDGMEIKYKLKKDRLFLTKSGQWNLEIFACAMTYGQADSEKKKYPGSEIIIISQLSKTPSDA